MRSIDVIFAVILLVKRRFEFKHAPRQTALLMHMNAQRSVHNLIGEDNLLLDRRI